MIVNGSSDFSVARKRSKRSLTPFACLVTNLKNLWTTTQTPYLPTTPKKVEDFKVHFQGSALVGRPDLGQSGIGGQAQELIATAHRKGNGADFNLF